MYKTSTLEAHGPSQLSRSVPSNILIRSVCRRKLFMVKISSTKQTIRFFGRLKIRTESWWKRQEKGNCEIMRWNDRRKQDRYDKTALEWSAKKVKCEDKASEKEMMLTRIYQERKKMGNRKIRKSIKKLTREIRHGKDDSKNVLL